MPTEHSLGIRLSDQSLDILLVVATIVVSAVGYDEQGPFGISSGPHLTEAQIYRIEERSAAKLPPNFREALILRELEGMSYREIADITGMPAGTVMSSLSRARGRLRQVLTTLMKRGHGAKFTANCSGERMSVCGWITQ
jgi:DNA-directed RNA polymerase specialized sigma24 family protein